MEYKIFTETLKDLESLSRKTDSILVAFSGGKDSLVCLDLCVRTFKRVVPFFLYFVPGLRCIEEQLDRARQRYGLEILQYPHWLLFRCLKWEVFCTSHWRNEVEMWEPKINDIHAAIIYETGIPFVVQGAKQSDSMWRRRYFTINKFDRIVYPLKKWHKRDVLAYLKIRGIPTPPSEGKNANGVDLTAPSVLWLYDKYPDDYQKMIEWFPFAAAIVKRRDWYGIQ